MRVKNQLSSDTERLAELINKYTGIPSSRIKEFVAENGAEYILSSANMLARTDAQREKLQALFEFKNLYEIVKGSEKEIILDSSEKSLEYFQNILGDKQDKERVAVAYMDSKLSVIATKIISEGSINSASMNAREIAREALYYNAVSAIVAHNHPTNSTQISPNDISSTAHVAHSLETLGVDLVDHIVVTRDQAISMSNLGIIDKLKSQLAKQQNVSTVMDNVSRYETQNQEGGNNSMDINNTVQIEMPEKPLEENGHVKELLDILIKNGKDTSGLTALLDHVKVMEDFIKSTENKIDDMKSQLSQMKEIQDSPIKNALQNTIKNLEAKVIEMKAQLAIIKNNIIEGCKKAVTAFKEKGISALFNLASFFKINNALQVLKDDSIQAAKMCDKSIADIESFSKEYHMAGRHFKNMARVVAGKDPIDNVKESGKFMRIMCSPFRASKSINLKISKLADKMIVSLEKLDRKVEAINKERGTTGKKPLMERLKDKKELIRQKELDMPKPERLPISKGLEV